MKKEILKGYDASLALDALAYEVVKNIRNDINQLIKSKKTDFFVIGSIYNLSILIENGSEISLGEKEVANWVNIIEKWKNRVKKRLTTDFIEELDTCIKTILSIAWEKDEDLNEINKREWCIDIKNEELLKKYHKIANEKYPVKLGVSLSKYLEICLEKLIDTDITFEKIENNEKDSKEIEVYNPTFLKNKSDYSLLISNFTFFSKKNIITAYDLENYVKIHLKQSVLKKLSFDCESSLFSVQSTDIKQLHLLNELLLNLKQKI